VLLLAPAFHGEINYMLLQAGRGGIDLID